MYKLMIIRMYKFNTCNTGKSALPAMPEGTQCPRASADISDNTQVPVLQLLCNTSRMLSYLYPYVFNSIMGCKANIKLSLLYPGQSSYKNMNIK